jgi:hypothetical protein
LKALWKGDFFWFRRPTLAHSNRCKSHNSCSCTFGDDEDGGNFAGDDGENDGDDGGDCDDDGNGDDDDDVEGDTSGGADKDDDKDDGKDGDADVVEDPSSSPAAVRSMSNITCVRACVCVCV